MNERARVLALIEAWFRCVYMASSAQDGGGGGGADERISGSCVGTGTCARLAVGVPPECLALAVFVRPRECEKLLEESDRATKELHEQLCQQGRHAQAFHNQPVLGPQAVPQRHRMFTENAEKQRHIVELRQGAADLRRQAGAVAQKAFALPDGDEDERLDFNQSWLQNQGWMLATDFALRWALRRLALGKSLHSRLTHESAVLNADLAVECLLKVAQCLQQIEAVRCRDTAKGTFVHWSDTALAELAVARTATSKLVTTVIEGDEDRGAQTLAVYISNLQPYTVYQFRARYFFHPAVEQAVASQLLSPVVEVLCREHTSQAQAGKNMEEWNAAQSVDWVVSVLGEMVDADQLRQDFCEEEIDGADLKARLRGTASRMRRLLRGLVTNPAEAVSLLIESAVELERHREGAYVAEGVPPRSDNWFVPAHWAPMRSDDQKLARVTVTPEAEPALWRDVAKRVSASLPEFNLVSIERVQNKPLWRRYVTYREQIAEQYGGQAAVSERDLFHFAGEAALDAVISSESVGFDPRLGGSSEYGAGTYFAEHAIYPVAYGQGWLAGSCRAERRADPRVTLVLAKVALGFCKDFGPRCRSERGDAAADEMGLPRGLLGQGDWSDRMAGRSPANIFARPPQRPEAGPNELYHSVSGTEGDLAWTENSRLRAHGAEYGRQYVTFETAQAYPELILDLHRKPSHVLAMMEQERGESDKAMTLGTHVVVNEVGRGTISGFTRNLVGSNSHHVTLDETGDVYILRVREVEWWVDQPAQLLDATEAAALERELNELSAAAEAQSEALPQARIAVVEGSSYKS